MGLLVPDRPDRLTCVRPALVILTGRDGRQMIQRHVVLGTSLAQGAGYAGAFQGMYDHLLCDEERRRDPFIALTLSAQRRVLR